MSFEKSGRVSAGWVHWDSLRHVQHQEGTLCESRIARLCKLRVFKKLQIFCARCMRCVYTSTDRLNVFYGALAAVATVALLVGMVVIFALVDSLSVQWAVRP